MVRKLGNVNLGGLKMTAAAEAALDKVDQLGMTVTSAYRTPQHDREVGGSGHGYHTLGQALDVDGGYAKNTEFADWAKSSGLFRSVLWQVSGHYDHVHVSWTAEGSGSGYHKPSDHVVKRGDKGGIVGVIQDLINVAKDNLFGPKTEKALKEFQRHQGLQDDGVVGDKTWDKLTHGYGRFFYQ